MKTEHFIDQKTTFWNSIQPAWLHIGSFCTDYQTKYLFNFVPIQGITFRRVGVPTANDIIKSSSKDAVRWVILPVVPVQSLCPIEISSNMILLSVKQILWLQAIKWQIWFYFFIVSRFLDSVPVTAIGYFRASAEKLIEERGAVEALAAALAHISGATSLEQRSLLNSDAVSYMHAHT